jgi:hypothetical protein
MASPPKAMTWFSWGLDCFVGETANPFRFGIRALALFGFVMV